MKTNIIKKICTLNALCIALALSGCGSTAENSIEEISSVTEAENETNTSTATETVKETTTAEETQNTETTMLGESEKAPTDSEGHYISPSGWVLDPNNEYDIDNELYNTVYYLTSAEDGTNFYGIYYIPETNENTDQSFREQILDYVIIEQDGYVYEVQDEWYGRFSIIFDISMDDYDNDGEKEYAAVLKQFEEYPGRGYDLKIYKKTDGYFKAYCLTIADATKDFSLDVVPDADGNGAMITFNKTDTTVHAKGISYVADEYNADFYGVSYIIDGNSIKMIDKFGFNYDSYSMGEITADVHFSTDGFTMDNFTHDYVLSPYYSLSAENGNYTLEYITEEKSEIVETGEYFVDETGSESCRPYLLKGPKLMGEKTIIFYEYGPGGMPFQSFYAECWERENTPKYITTVYGESCEPWYDSSTIYSVDVDGDRIEEVVTNCTAGGDGVTSVTICKKIDGELYSTKINYYKFFNEYDFPGADRPSVAYDPEKNVLLSTFTYSDPNDRSTVHEYPIDLDRFVFEKYEKQQ